MNTVIAFGIGAPGMWEMLVVAGIALLLFGKRLPEVARSLGKGIVEFKKGVHGIEDDVQQATYSSPSSPPRPAAADEVDEVTAPKFEPPEAKSVETAESGTAETEPAETEPAETRSEQT